MSFSSLLLGIRERFFGHTRKVFWAYANGCLRRPSPLQGRRLNPVRTLPTLHQDGAFSQGGRCFQPGRVLVSIRKDAGFSQEGCQRVRHLNMARFRERGGRGVHFRRFHREIGVNGGGWGWILGYARRSGKIVKNVGRIVKICLKRRFSFGCLWKSLHLCRQLWQITRQL